MRVQVVRTLQVLSFRVESLREDGSGFRDQHSGVRVWGLGFEIEGCGFRV